MTISAALQTHPAIWRGDQLGTVLSASVPTGFAQLDAELPGGGWPTATLTEIFSHQQGIGELSVLKQALARLSANGRWLAWIAPPYLPYAPALQTAGIDLAHLLLIKTRSRRETLWAIEQALRCAACSAVLAWPDKITYPELRRLQLAAGSHPVLAILFRPPSAADESSPATLRLSLRSQAGDLEVRVLKRRGALLAHPILLRAYEFAGRTPSKHLHHVVDRAPFPVTASRSVSAACSAI